MKKKSDGPSGKLRWQTLDPKNRRNKEPIWWPYLYRGRTSIFEGPKGVLKSSLAQRLLISVADGSPMIDGTEVTQGRVLYLDVENDSDEDVIPFLEDNGLTNWDNLLYLPTRMTFDDFDAYQEIEKKLDEFKPDLLIIDTLGHFVGSGDVTLRFNEASTAMGRFTDLAKKFKVSTLILRHHTKGGGQVEDKGQGSVAISGTVRCVVTVGKWADDDHPPEENWRAFCASQQNLGPEKSTGFTFRRESLPDKNGFTDRSRLVAGSEVEMTAQQLFENRGELKEDDNGNDENREKARDHAEKFVLDSLRHGPKDPQTLEREAEGRAGLFSVATLRRVIRKLKDDGEVASKPKKSAPKERVYRLVADAEDLGGGVLRIDFGGCGAKAKVSKIRAHARIEAARLKRKER